MIRLYDVLKIHFHDETICLHTRTNIIIEYVPINPSKRHVFFKYVDKVLSTTIEKIEKLI